MRGSFLTRVRPFTIIEILHASSACCFNARHSSSILEMENEGLSKPFYCKQGGGGGRQTLITVARCL